MVDLNKWLVGLVFFARLSIATLVGGISFASLFAAEWQLSNREVYQYQLAPRDGSMPIGPLHAWVLTIATRDGAAFIPGQLRVSGGMPGHGHGLPTDPRATRHLGDGRFLIEGVQFNMPGEWVLNATFTGPNGLDTVTERFKVLPARQGENLLAHELGLSSTDLALIESLSLAALQPPIERRDNGLAHDASAIALGAALFGDPELSNGGQVSCATCHQPDKYFTDGLARSVGSATTQRHAPSLLGSAYRRWWYWDGRRDSLWSQALTPLETNGEMDNTRTNVVRYVAGHADYGATFRRLFSNDESFADRQRFPEHAGPFGAAQGKAAWAKMSVPDRALVNAAFVVVGKAIAAYERTLLPGPSRFDRFVALLKGGKRETQDLLDTRELNGLKLFVDQEKTRCLQCHNGPLLTNEGFHNIGTGPSVAGGFDYGRAFGLQAALFNPFNCRSTFSDDTTCEPVVFAQTTELPAAMHGAFKVPSLRNVGDTGPYLHDGRHDTLEQVLDWYIAPPDPASTGHELQPLTLTETERDDLAAFLRTLTQRNVETGESS